MTKMNSMAQVGAEGLSYRTSENVRKCNGLYKIVNISKLLKLLPNLPIRIMLFMSGLEGELILCLRQPSTLV